METCYDLAIIGGGPGGIGAAVEAKYLGIEKVLLIEKTDNHSHTIRKFYKANKRVDKDWQGQSVELQGNIPFADGTKESTLDYFDRLLDEHAIDTRFNCAVEKVSKVDECFEINATCGQFKARHVVVSIGRMGKPNKPSYKIPPSIKQQVNFNLDKCGNDEKILVVGGGDSAVEYACDLSCCNDVTLNYRREALTRPNPTNNAAVEALANEGKVRLKLGVDIESLENEHGKVKVNFTDGSETFDRVIYAIGGTTPKDFLKSCGIPLDSNGEPTFDEHYETPVKGLYVAGDIVFKSGGSIAIALNHGYTIAQHILQKE